ncbi:hypothetical protein [Aquella oligotrophica]|uniref:Uncharacterized protein n=1 Tax=Aquella oligotrophica TaxID=2067065 RepID=A0A2I7N957_9NEIS|nr:hypothetical protein [Aquella oligotrophica]AUR52990.1 hypothetical protein CUN60_12035 [Aquella oligotrophica]
MGKLIFILALSGCSSMPIVSDNKVYENKISEIIAKQLAYDCTSSVSFKGQGVKYDDISDYKENSCNTVIDKSSIQQSINSLAIQLNNYNVCNPIDDRDLIRLQRSWSSPCIFLMTPKDRYGEKYNGTFLQDFSTDLNSQYNALKKNVLFQAQKIVDTQQVADEKKQNEKIAEDNRKKEAKESCIANFQKSILYKKYYAQKDKFIKQRYNQCINNGFSSMQCYSFKLQDSIGYDIENHPPSANCD